jgi:L-ascorbate metabolism protein UlaG (beta-lactamase superfamily)
MGPIARVHGQGHEALRGGDMSGLGFTFTWYGHACVEVVTEGGKVILFDPWFGNPTSPKRADEVDRCDLLLVTHGHGDHVGDAVALASRLQPAWPSIHEMSLWLEPQLPGSDAVIGMNKGGTVTAAGLAVTMVRAEHSAGDWNPDHGVPLHLGEPVGFVVELENGRRIYYAGDTDVFGDMRLIGELHRPDVAFLPIGGHYTMDPRGAAKAVELLGVTTVVPIHYGTFPALAGTPKQLRAELDERGLGSIEVVAPERGEATS